VKTFALILGLLLTLYSAAALVAAYWFPTSTRAEARLCRLFLCDTAAVIQDARRLLWSDDPSGPRLAVDAFRRALQRDTHEPRRWADLGDAFLDTGDIPRARYCFQRAVARAPHRPPLLLRAANFYYQVGDIEPALRLDAAILAAVPDYDPVVFSHYSRLVPDFSTVLRLGLPENRRAAQSFLRYLLSSDTDTGVEHARQLWQWLAARRFNDTPLAAAYVQFLLNRGRPEEAARAWLAQLGPAAESYRRSNYIFNGDFENEPSGAPLDWRISPVAGVEAGADNTVARSGRASLRIAFPGAENYAYSAIGQYAVVKPGPWSFTAWVRTGNITTDEGIRFRLYDPEQPRRLDILTAPSLATRDWTPIETQIRVPPGTRILHIQIVRLPSRKIDNKIKGTAWIDSVTLAEKRGL
jgi:tetratricopeptide (TPR) repeat protein